jgi:DNA-3-methyladenine glycosylase II
MTKSYLNLFPTPQDIVDTDIATLRTAGLSARKAEYGPSQCHLIFNC